MAELERLWTDQELFDLGNTVDTLRRIRSAATVGLEPLPSGVLGAFGKWRHPKRFETPTNPQEVLADAETLGLYAGDFLAERLAKDRRDHAKFEAWDSTVQGLQKLYWDYQPITFANTKVMEPVLSTIGHMRMVHADPSYMLRWDLLNHNYVGADSVEELLKKDVTVISPLSGDFLLASVYRAILKQTKSKTFHLKAVALSKHLEGIVLPSPDRILEQSAEMAIFLDVTDTGKTGRVLLDKLAEHYPGKLIHQPNLDTMRQRMHEFQPSRRMVRVLGEDYFTD